MAKARSYTVQDLSGVPSLTLKGKFLSKEFGLSFGDRVKLVEGRNMLILLKVPTVELEYQQNIERLKVCRQELKVCEEEVRYLQSQLEAGQRHMM